MAKLIFTQEEINSVFNEDEAAFHKYYKENVSDAEEISVHADGKFPEKLITERRPNEPQNVLEYRKNVFEPKTEPTFSRVFSSLQKIRRSSEWSIRYPKNIFTKINPEETLEEYCEKNYPYFTSVTNWVFDVVLRKYLIDPNSVAFVYPKDFAEGVLENEYLKPKCELFPSNMIIYFVPEDYAILKNPAGCKYFVRNKQVIGRSYYFITINEVLRYDQINNKEDFSLMLRYAHGLNQLPVFQLKGMVVDSCDNMFRYKSRITSMLPDLNDAAREYSDLQGVKALHMHPERWEFSQNECKLCKGTGLRPNPDWFDGCDCDANVACPSCHGHAYVAAGPFSKVMVRPVNNAVEGGMQVPIPPVGEVQKDPRIIELQEQSVKNHLYDALAAINCEHLAEVPLAESGVSKSHDRDEANNWTHSVAEDVVAFQDNVYYFTALYRYKFLYSFKEIIGMLPAIPVPEKYDLMTTSEMQQEIKSAKEAKLNPLILDELERDYVGKRFGTDPDVALRLQLIHKLDPLPNISSEDKMVILSNKGIDQISYIISSNINEFVQRALDIDEKFSEKPLPEQKETMRQFAEEILPEPIVIPDMEEEEEMPMPPVNGKPKPVPA